MEQGIRNILEAGIQAPSGENSQPWRFMIQGNRVQLYNDPTRDTSLYNSGQHGSLVAHGALIENIEIAAPGNGYVAKTSLFPDQNNPNYIAHIELVKNEAPPDSLARAIPLRATNRKPYAQGKLPEDIREELIDAAQKTPGARLVLIDDPEKMKIIAASASQNERILFENQYLHDFFYDHIRWTLAEDQKKKNGFYIKTLEFAPPQALFFRLLKNWNLANLLNTIGLSKFIAGENVKIYTASSAFGAILVPNTASRAYVDAGRLFERVWLTAALRDLSVQPFTGLLFLSQYVKDGGARLEEKHKMLIRTSYESVIQEVNPALDHGVNSSRSEETVALLFRIGNGGVPSARSPRFPLESFLR